MTRREHGPRRLEAEDSQAATSPAGDTEDALSPSASHRASVGASESQRLGDSPPLDNPIVSFPDAAAGEDR